MMVLTYSLSGCSYLQNNSPTPLPTKTAEAVETTVWPATETSKPSESVTPTVEATVEPLSSNRTAYQFEVDLDYNKHRLDVQQTILYQNQTGQALAEIKLVVPPNVKPRVFALESLSLTGDVNMADFALDGNTLTIHLDQPLSESGSVSIAIVYTLTPRLQGGILGYTARQLNLSDWYPFIPPFDPDSGWIIHQPAEVGEYLVYDSADFDLTLNLVSATGLTVAASADAAPLDLDSYRIVQNSARGITFSVSDQYTLLTNTTNGITVKGYIFKGDEVAGQAAVDYTANALQLYSELFGLPYPHQTLSVVESDFP
ncbi:MAG: hypothetical protein Q7U31_11115, partial [Anaerolineaceae bacterium]|nr:hypothetical protein [Anaerolineaceae bacterium]